MLIWMARNLKKPMYLPLDGFIWCQLCYSISSKHRSGQCNKEPTNAVKPWGQVVPDQPFLVAFSLHKPFPCPVAPYEQPLLGNLKCGAEWELRGNWTFGLSRMVVCKMHWFCVKTKSKCSIITLTQLLIFIQDYVICQMMLVPGVQLDWCKLLWECSACPKGIDVSLRPNSGYMVLGYLTSTRLAS